MYTNKQRCDNHLKQSDKTLSDDWPSVGKIDTTLILVRTCRLEKSSGTTEEKALHVKFEKVHIFEIVIFKCISANYKQHNMLLYVLCALFEIQLPAGIFYSSRSSRPILKQYVLYMM